MPTSITTGARGRQARRLLVFAAGAAVMAATALPPAAAGVHSPDASAVLAAKPTGPVGGTWFGAHVNARNGEKQLASIRTFEGQLDRHLDVANKYHGFSSSNTTTSLEASLISTGTVPLVSWRGTDSSYDPDRARKIALGQYDSTIIAMANSMKALNGPVLLRFNWEMEGPPGNRQYIGPASEFKAAWQHIYNLFQQQGATNVAFVWAPRAAAWKKGIAYDFYPGDEYVDWIGASAVPTSTWPGFAATYTPFYNSSSTLHPDKPLLIWGGVREDPQDPNYKATWMRNAESQLQQWPRVKAFVYYHALSPSGSLFWADTSPQSFDAFQRMGCLAYFHTYPQAGECGP